jgi:hypothetical protein
MAALVALLVAEGASSLLRGRGILRDRESDSLADWVVALRRDADRFAAAANLEGVYQAHPDPFVRYTVRANATVEIRGITVATDELGMRKRPGPPPAADALRIAVLGDSVAFGYGVNDDATLAAALERRLTAALADGSRPIACFTIAAPGWNLRQAIRFLLDHRDAVRPDVVILVPNNNDLYDADSVAESGHRFYAPDLAQRDPRLIATANAQTFLNLGLNALRRREGGARIEANTGPEIMTSGLTMESRARYDALAAEILALEDALKRDGKQLWIVRFFRERFAFLLEAALARQRAVPPVVPFLRNNDRAFTLGDDPHPNPQTFEALATLLATEVGPRLLGDSFAATRLPKIDGAIDAALDRDPPGSHTLARAAESIAAAASELRPAFDTATVEGVRQVYGGVNPDGTLGLTATLALARIGPRVRVHVQPLIARTDLVPNRVTVRANGAVLGAIDVTLDPIDCVAVFPLQDEPGATAVEISLVPDRTVITQLAGASQNASVRIVRVEVLPD